MCASLASRCEPRSPSRPPQPASLPDGYPRGRNSFDSIRLLAALQVLIGHATYHLGVVHDSGLGQVALRVLSAFPGVPIFFMISGFLVTASFERRPNLQDYFVSRFLRIYPALWACLAA